MILFDRLISAASGGDTRPVKPVTINWHIQVDRAGRVLNVVPGQSDLRTKVLQVDRGTNVAPSYGPVDTSIYILGYNPEDPDAGVTKRTAWVRAQRDLAAVLERDPESDPALVTGLRALARFGLDKVEVAKALGQIQAQAKKLTHLDWICVDVEGVPPFALHPAVVSAHVQAQAKKQGDDVRGDCPFCGQRDVPMTRLYGKSGKSSLISFNTSSFEAYSQDQGYTAPCCLPCSSLLQRGLAQLLDRASWSPTGTSNTKMLWWADWSGGPSLWSIWSGLWPKAKGKGKDKTDGEIDEATPEAKPDAEAKPIDVGAVLGALPPVSDLLVLEQNMARWAVRRHGAVRREDVIDRMTRWVEVFGKRPLPIVVDAIHGSPRMASRAQTWDGIYVGLVYHLLLGEPVPQVWIGSARRAVVAGVAPGLPPEPRKQREGYLRVLRGLLTYVEDENMKIEKDGVNLEGAERAHYHLGRAYQRAAACQRRQSRPMYGLDGRVNLAARQSWTVVQSQILKHLRIRVRKNGNTAMVDDHQGHTHLRRALDYGLASGTPSHRQRAAFVAGYQDQREADAEAKRLYYEAKGQAATAATAVDDDTDLDLDLIQTEAAAVAK